MNQFDHDVLHLLADFQEDVEKHTNKINAYVTEHYIKEEEMNQLLKDLRNNLVFLTTKAIDKKIDGKEIGINIDKGMDAELGKVSEKIQRGSVTNLLMEILEGLWDESPNTLRLYLSERYQLPKDKE